MMPSPPSPSSSVSESSASSEFERISDECANADKAEAGVTRSSLSVSERSLSLAPRQRHHTADTTSLGLEDNNRSFKSFCDLSTNFSESEYEDAVSSAAAMRPYVQAEQLAPVERGDARMILSREVRPRWPPLLVPSALKQVLNDIVSSQQHPTRGNVRFSLLCIPGDANVVGHSSNCPQNMALQLSCIACRSWNSQLSAYRDAVAALDAELRVRSPLLKALFLCTDLMTVSMHRSHSFLLVLISGASADLSQLGRKTQGLACSLQPVLQRFFSPN